jgi:hypothetical protein
MIVNVILYNSTQYKEKMGYLAKCLTDCELFYCYAECRQAECHFVECCGDS